MTAWSTMGLGNLIATDGNGWTSNCFDDLFFTWPGFTRTISFGCGLAAAAF